jgi:hypothetical protein
MVHGSARLQGRKAGPSCLITGGADARVVAGRTLGVDLAAQAKQTAVCLLSWGKGQAAILPLDEEQHALIAASDHLLDALLCSLVGRAALVDATLPIPAELRELAAAEGWIALPQSDSLPKLGLYS